MALYAVKARPCIWYVGEYLKIDIEYRIKVRQTLNLSHPLLQVRCSGDPS